MGDRLEGLRVAILAADMVERVELVEPRKALEDAGAETDLISLESGAIRSFNHFDPADELTVDRAIEDVDSDEYDAVIIPGGVGNPDMLRTSRRGRRVRAGHVRRRQADRLDLPRAVGPGRGRHHRATTPSPRGPRCRRTSATPAATGSTRRWSPTRASSRAGSPTTSRPSTGR